MELQHRLVRKAIDIAVDKALEDMKGNTQRSIRNLLDLGLLFAKSENLRLFLTVAKKMVTRPGNPYHHFAARMISDVENDTIKRVSVNLGYGSLTYGAGKLKRKQKEWDRPLPWILLFDGEELGPAQAPHVERFVREGQELGIHSFIFCPHERDDLPTLCGLAKRVEECLFVFKLPPAFISEQTAAPLGELRNAVVSLQGQDGMCPCGPNDAQAFRLLRQHRCFYGFHVGYNERNGSRVASAEYIRSAIGLGSLFGVYVADADTPAACRNAVYDFVCRERGETGQPIIALEWERDVRDINEQILPDGGGVANTLAELTCCKCIEAKDLLTTSLLELLGSERLRTNP